MKDAPLFSRSVAEAVFIELYRALDPALAIGCPGARCDRFCAVGGYRRGKTEMKDLELLYIPRMRAEVDPGDLFGASRPVDQTEAVWAELVRAGVLEPRLSVSGNPSWGPKIKLARHVPTGLPVDLFAATPENYHNLLVVRTGPKLLNIRIAEAARAKGWEWEIGEGGFVTAGSTWALDTRHRRTMRSEAEVFKFVGLDYQRAEGRTAV